MGTDNRRLRKPTRIKLRLAGLRIVLFTIILFIFQKCITFFFALNIELYNFS